MSRAPSGAVMNLRHPSGLLREAAATSLITVSSARGPPRPRLRAVPGLLHPDYSWRWECRGWTLVIILTAFDRTNLSVFYFCLVEILLR